MSIRSRSLRYQTRDGVVVLIDERREARSPPGTAIWWLGGGAVPAEFRILGPVELRRDGRVVPLGGPTQQALLVALLLRANQPVSLDWLVEVLWEEPPASAVANIRTYASALRRALAGSDDVDLVVERRSYLLRVVPGALDAVVFSSRVAQGREALSKGDLSIAVHALDQALRLWRGQAAAGLSCSRVLAGHLASLEEQRMAAAEDLAEARLARGEHTAVVAEFRAFVAEHPFRERAWGQLMLGLYRSGDPAAALDAFAEARATMVDQLGMEPGVELQRMQQAILTHDPAIARTESRQGSLWAAAVPVKAPAGSKATVAIPRQLLAGPAHLVGRDRALSAVRAGLTAVSARGAIVAVHGAGGSASRLSPCTPRMRNPLGFPTGSSTSTWGRPIVSAELRSHRRRRSLGCSVR